MTTFSLPFERKSWYGLVVVSYIQILVARRHTGMYMKYESYYQNPEAYGGRKGAFCNDK